jgi:Holliday junction DNA helicase RuvA
LYDFLRGKLVEIQPGRVVLDVGGIGYSIFIPDHAPEVSGSKGEEIHFWTHLHFREDSINLYGFVERRERELFLMLLKVNGVGPKLAMQILSGIKPDELIRAMAEEDWKRLTLIPGIGPKTARRLLIELKERLTDRELISIPGDTVPQYTTLSQAYNALESLGFQTEQIRAAVKDIPASKTLEEIIKLALIKLTT